MMERLSLGISAGSNDANVTGRCQLLPSASISFLTPQGMFSQRFERQSEPAEVFGVEISVAATLFPDRVSKWVADEFVM
jgi:hypothetical protein